MSAVVLGALFTAHLAEASPLSFKLAAFAEETLSALSGQPVVQAATATGVRGMIVKFSLGIAIIGGASGLWWTAQEGDNGTSGNTPGHASVQAYIELGDTRESSSSPPFRTGVYRLNPLPPGKAVVTATVRTPDADTTLRKTTELMLLNNEVLTLDFDFSGSGTVQGVIGNFSPGEEIAVIAVPGNVPLPQSPGLAPNDLIAKDYYARARVKDASYVLESLPPGVYSIHAISLDRHLFNPNNPRIAAGTVKITGAETVELDLAF